MASKIQFGGQPVKAASHWKAQIPWASNPLPSGAHLKLQLWKPPNLPWNLRSWDLMTYDPANHRGQQLFQLKELTALKVKVLPSACQDSTQLTPCEDSTCLPFAVLDPWNSSPHRDPSICWGKPLKYLKFCNWDTWAPLRLQQFPLPPEDRNPQRLLPNEADSPRKNRWACTKISLRTAASATVTKAGPSASIHRTAALLIRLSLIHKLISQALWPFDKTNILPNSLRGSWAHHLSELYIVHVSY